MDDGENARPGWGVWGGVFFVFWGGKIEWSMTSRWTLPPMTMSMPLAMTPKT